MSVMVCQSSQMVSALTDVAIEDDMPIFSTGQVPGFNRDGQIEPVPESG